MLRFFGYLLIIPIRIYQKVLSPLFPSTCRFNPTCSVYAEQAIRTKGPFVGFWLAVILWTFSGKVEIVNYLFGLKPDFTKTMIEPQERKTILITGPSTTKGNRVLIHF